MIMQHSLGTGEYQKKLHKKPPIFDKVNWTRHSVTIRWGTRLGKSAGLLPVCLLIIGLILVGVSRASGYRLEPQPRDINIPFERETPLIEVSDLSARVGQQAKTNIDIESGDVFIGAVTLTLLYDDKQLHIEKCIFEESDFQGVCHLEEVGRIRVTGIHIEGATNTSNLATLVVKPLAEGTSQIEIIQIDTLADRSGNRIQAALKSAIIKGIASTMATPAATPTATRILPTLEFATSTSLPPGKSIDQIQFLPIVLKHR